MPARRDRPNRLSRRRLGVPRRPRRRPWSEMAKLGMNVGLASIPRRISRPPEPVRIERTVRLIAVRGPRPGSKHVPAAKREARLRNVVSYRGRHRDVAVLRGLPRGVNTSARRLRELRVDRTTSHKFGDRVVGRGRGVKGGRAVAVQEKLVASRRLCRCGRDGPALDGSRGLNSAWGLRSR